MSDTFGDTNFVDNIHLDADAAAQVTRWLAEILTTSGVDAPADGDDACGTVEVVDGVGYIIPVGLCRNATTG
jgi:hypothetical protein